MLQKAIAAVVLAICCTTAYAADLNVVVVFDGSGSMNEHMRGGVKIDVAKNALLSVLNTIPANTNVGILCFSGNSNGWIYPLQQMHYEGAAKVIRNVQAGGGTPLGRFITMGGDALLEQRKKDKYGLYRLLVITDGLSGDNCDTPVTGAGGLLEKGITISVIGVNMNVNHTLATQVPYRNATDPAGLATAVASVFAETPANALQEDFNTLAGLDTTVAQTILKTLSTVDNSRIGTSCPKENNTITISTVETWASGLETKSQSIAWWVAVIVVCVLAVIFAMWYLGFGEWGI